MVEAEKPLDLRPFYIGAGVGLAGVAGYVIYDLFFRKTEFQKKLERDYSKAVADLERLLEKIRLGKTITEDEVRAEYLEYKPKLDVMNQHLVAERATPILLPKDFDALPPEERAIGLKVYYMGAVARKAPLVDPRGGLWRTLQVMAFAAFGVGAFAVLFGKVPDLIRRYRPPPPVSPVSKTIYLVDHKDKRIVDREAHVYVGENIYKVTNGVLSLSLLPGKYIIHVVISGFKELTKTIFVTRPETNIFTCEPLVHPTTGERMPERTPNEIVRTTPRYIIESISIWLGVPVRWIYERPVEGAIIIGLVIALILALLSVVPGDEVVVAASLSSYLRRIGFAVPLYKIIGRPIPHAILSWVRRTRRI